MWLHCGVCGTFGNRWEVISSANVTACEHSLSLFNDLRIWISDGFRCLKIGTGGGFVSSFAITELPICSTPFVCSVLLECDSFSGKRDGSILRDFEVAVGDVGVVIEAAGWAENSHVVESGLGADTAIECDVGWICWFAIV